MRACIIQARMGSTRLPGKVLKKIKNKPLLSHIIDRIKISKKVNKIIVATTNKKKDNPIVNLCNKKDIDYFRGSEEDVLDRYYKSAKKYNLNKDDTIIRITADCPVVDPYIMDEVIDLFEDENADYAWNNRTYPDGLDVEVFSFGILKKAWKEAKTKYEREHVTPYIKENKEKFRQVCLEYKKNMSKYRWTVDEKKDLEVIKIIYDELYDKDKIFTFKDICGLFNERPELIKINAEHNNFIDISD